MVKEKLKKTSNEGLVNFFERAIELETKQGGNGKTPFDADQLKKEILKRMGDGKDS